MYKINKNFERKMANKLLNWGNKWRQIRNAISMTIKNKHMIGMNVQAELLLRPKIEKNKVNSRAMTGCSAYQFNSLASIFFMSINVDIWHTHYTCYAYRIPKVRIVLQLLSIQLLQIELSCICWMSNENEENGVNQPKLIRKFVNIYSDLDGRMT